MPIRQLLIFIVLILLTAGVVLWVVTAYRKPSPEVRLDAPGVHVETDKNGTKVEAPGVKL